MAQAAEINPFATSVPGFQRLLECCQRPFPVYGEGWEVLEGQGLAHPITNEDELEVQTSASWVMEKGLGFGVGLAVNLLQLHKLDAPVVGRLSLADVPKSDMVATGRQMATAVEAAMYLDENPLGSHYPESYLQVINTLALPRLAVRSYNEQRLFNAVAAYAHSRVALALDESRMWSELSGLTEDHTIL